MARLDRHGLRRADPRLARRRSAVPRHLPGPAAAVRGQRRGRRRRRSASCPAGPCASRTRRPSRTSAGTRSSGPASTRCSTGSPTAPTSTSSTRTPGSRRRPTRRRRPRPRPSTGGPFVSAVARGPLLGVQFHPERSGADGLRLLANFVELVELARRGRLMLRRRVIPCLDVADGRVVKGTRFVDLVDEGDPPELAERYAARGRRRARLPRHHGRPRAARHAPRHRRADRATRVHPADRRRRGAHASTRCATCCGPGADKVSLNTAAVADPTLISRCAAPVRAPGGRRRHRCRVAAGPTRTPAWEVVVKGGREPTGLDAVAWAERACDLGAGELLVTSIDRDGTGSGFDTELLRAITSRVSRAGHRLGRRRRARPTSWRRSVDGGADAVLAASIFHRRIHAIADGQGGDGRGRAAGPARAGRPSA